MKIFTYYFSDKKGFGGTVKFKAKTKTEAEKALKQYIKSWHLAPVADLEIVDIQEI